MPLHFKHIQESFLVAIVFNNHEWLTTHMDYRGLQEPQKEALFGNATYVLIECVISKRNKQNAASLT